MQLAVSLTTYMWIGGGRKATVSRLLYGYLFFLGLFPLGGVLHVGVTIRNLSLIIATTVRARALTAVNVTLFVFDFVDDKVV